MSLNRSGSRAVVSVVAPLPLRDGIAPSRVHLPNGDWATIYDFLVERFRFTAPPVIYERLVRGEIVDAKGVPITPQTPYAPHQWLWYYREVPDEPEVPFEIDILYRDAQLLVIDKPHFLASIPGGRYLKETALTRLRQSLGLPDLSPIHRLDRETAGVMMFTIDPSCRGAYQSLFQSRDVVKVYEAVAPLNPALNFPLRRETRLEAKATHFTMHEVDGPPNSSTFIELLRSVGEYGLYRLTPHTGRKHQLRVHMSSLGIPICHDLFYPELQPSSMFDDFSRPLQLLARQISFCDPYTGKTRTYTSNRALAMAG